MLDDDNPTGSNENHAAPPAVSEAPAGPPAEAPAAKKAAAKKTAVKKTAAKKATTKKATTKKAAVKATAEADSAEGETAGEVKPVKRTTRKTTAKKTASAAADAAETPAAETPSDAGSGDARRPPAIAPLFQAPDAASAPTPRKRSARKSAADTDDDPTGEAGTQSPAQDRPAKRTRGGSARRDSAQDEGTDDTSEDEQSTGSDQGSGDGDDGDDSGTKRRPRRRGGRRRRKGSGDGDDSDTNESDDDQSEDDGDDSGSTSSASRRRRRRRRSGDEGSGGSDDPEKTVTRVRKTRNPEDEITALAGSTRLEAKKQRRREGREAGRRRAPIVSEAEFLARREAVDRVMVIRQRDDLTQIGVLEDKVLVEHYVARESQTSLIGNVYLGRVQNVLPSMEAAFIDIGKGRNAVLYAGEVNWTTLGAKDNQPRKIESFLKSGQPVLVQVTKDPIGHKGARLTSQVSLPGRFLVYVPDGTTSGISRKLPDNERNRLKTLLKEIVPDTAGVIVRTAAEGASEEELTQDVERLTARWNDIEAKVNAGQSPQLLYGEPDLTLKVVRDLFTEDFAKLVVQGDDAWDLVDGYVSHVAPDLRDRLERYRPEDEGNGGTDLFATYRLDEQIAKGLDRKVWLPSGGSLIIDRTEAMTVVDVNTGKFTGSGGNLEETVTKNNLEAAEEMVRQLRLRDIGGIIVIDFIDMVLESNRDLVLRRMVECLGRDRTRHQVAEVTSLGLVQMTRKRIGTGLLEAFTEECEHCKGRGLVTHDHPIEQSARVEDDSRRGGRRSRGGRGKSGSDAGNDSGNGNGGNRSGSGGSLVPSPKDVAAVARPENADRPPLDEQDEPDQAEQDQLTPDAAEDRAVEAPVTADSASETVDGNGVDTEAASADPTPDDVVAESSEPETPEPREVTAEPAPPTVVTTRRRSVRRAAGPPAGVLSGTDGSSGNQADDDLPKGASSPGTDGAAPEGDSGELVPLTAASSIESVDGEESEDDSEDGAFVLHVPIKRKGSRKR